MSFHDMTNHKKRKRRKNHSVQQILDRAHGSASGGPLAPPRHVAFLYIVANANAKRAFGASNLYDCFSHIWNSSRLSQTRDSRNRPPTALDLLSFSLLPFRVSSTSVIKPAVLVPCTKAVPRCLVGETPASYRSTEQRLLVLLLLQMLEQQALQRGPAPAQLRHHSF
jgi:hypothetical protein